MSGIRCQQRACRIDGREFEARGVGRIEAARGVREDRAGIGCCGPANEEANVQRLYSKKKLCMIFAWTAPEPVISPGREGAPLSEGLRRSIDKLFG